MRRIQLNDVTALRLVDAAPPPADWTYAFAAHAADIDDPARKRWAPDGRFHTSFTIHALVRDGAATLVDAGIGPDASAYFKGLSGRLDRELAEAGLSPEMVTCVMFTHLHLDHIGWASRDGRPCFPNARYVAPSAELAHWRARGADAALPHHVAAFERHIQPLVASGLLDGLEAGQPAPGATPLFYMPLPGHTPGHSGVVFDPAGKAFVIAGDAWHSPAQIERPDWGHRADRDPAMAARSRQALAQWAAERGALVAAGHFPDEQGFGQIVAKEAGGFVWRPLA